MYEYKLKLKYKVENCYQCPFRHERVIQEPVETRDKLTGIVSISRIISNCTLKDEPILTNEFVEAFESKCPLKGNVIYFPDEK